MQLDALKERFWDTPGVDVVEGQGGLAKLELRCDAGEADVYTLGAHVTHFRPAGGEPVLWMSEASWFEPGKPIRGGIPICWPWFGPHDQHEDYPSHGFARTQLWQVTSGGLDSQGRAFATLQLDTNDESRRTWAGEFELQVRVVVGETLTVELTTRNVGQQAFRITEALHSYFRIGDVREVSVRGLEGVEYLDKVDGGKRKTQGDEPVTFTAETDRPYLATESTCILDDPALGRRIVVEKTGSRSTVVWNPHIAKAVRMPDFGDEEWLGMVCIETANVHDDAVTIAPGEQHVIAAVHRVDE